MHFLLVVKQRKNADTFMETLDQLVERGHAVTLAIQERDDNQDEWLAVRPSAARVAVVPAPDVRTDRWDDVSELIRRLRDFSHYLQPVMAPAVKLRGRVFQKLRQDLALGQEADVVAGALRSMPSSQVKRLESALRVAEHGLPTDPGFDEFLQAHRPDVLLLSPLVHFGPGQFDLLATAQRRRIPVWMLLYSWDNLSTKGALHRWPDRMFVWNEQQKREAEQLHGFPAERVVVAGAPRFDPFFTLTAGMTREEFHAPLGLDPAKPTVLYVASSRLVSASELPFVRKWIDELRGSRSAALRDCNVLVRPHPDIPLLPADVPLARHRWPAMPALDGFVARPFAEPRAIVLRTSFNTPQGLYESIAHSAAVVGLNTTAELEAGIAGRPVFTILADPADADGQGSTVHFHYLTQAHGGFVRVASTFAEHVAQLAGALDQPADAAPIRAFVQAFLRPYGIDRPVAPILAELLERTASGDAPPAEAPPAALEEERLDELVPELPADDGRAVLPIADTGGAIRVYATATSARKSADAVRLDKGTVEWLKREVSVGDVLYDVGAGIGGMALVAAKQRGAAVVAFEAGYAAFAQLCDNLLLNACETSVIPIPLALSDRDALAELKYPLGRPGDQRYKVRHGEWRMRPHQSNRSYAQPACLMRLDGAVERYRLPPPNHLRLSPFAPVLTVMAGAVATLASSSLKTICLHVSPEEEIVLIERLRALGWIAAARRVRSGDVQLLLAREPECQVDR